MMSGHHRFSPIRSIFGEFMLMFTVIMMALLFAIGWRVYHIMSQTMEDEYLKALGSLVEEKAASINGHIDGHLERVESFSMMLTTKQAMSDFATAYERGVDSEAYRQEMLKYNGYFTKYLAHWHNHDLFLIDLQGNLVYSVKHESDFATNLLTGPYSQTGLGDVFRSALRKLQVSNSSFAYYKPSKEVASFIAAPVIEHDKLIGVAVLQFDTNHFYDIINNYPELFIKAYLNRFTLSVPL